ncbi:Holliday junction resolvase RuvX [Vallitaleaceae bacterium 9-2]
MRIMGLDYGSKTIGVAMSDPLGWTAQGIETISRQDPGNLIDSIKRLKSLVDEYEVELIVVGLPKHMNNDLGERADRTLYFVKRIERELGIPVATFDERLSTVAAERVLTEGNVRKTEQKKYIDKVAAALILQTYLDLKRN